MPRGANCPRNLNNLKNQMFRRRRHRKGQFSCHTIAVWDVMEAALRRDKRLVAAIITILLAGGIGHVVQYGLDNGGRDAAQASVLPVALANSISTITLPGIDAFSEETAERSLRAAFPRPPAAALAPVSLRRGIVRRNDIPADTLAAPDTTIYGALDTQGAPCEAALEATAEPGAMVRLALKAACRPDTRVEVVHEGLRFAEATSARGDLEILVPAFVEAAAFQVTLGDDVPRVVEVRVPDAALHDRVALQWQGEGRVSLHAFEFGAGYGDPGHVYPDRLDAARARGVAVGRLVELGNPGIGAPLRAEIYTFPTGHVSNQGVVRLHVETEVTAFTCGTEVAAEAIQSVPGGRPSTVAVRIAMPDCDAVGEILVLKNVLRDLRIASN